MPPARSALAGPIGATGAVGAPGPKGAAGARGAKGAKGDDADASDLQVTCTLVKSKRTKAITGVRCEVKASKGSTRVVARAREQEDRVGHDPERARRAHAAEEVPR